MAGNGNNRAPAAGQGGGLSEAALALDSTAIHPGQAPARQQDDPIDQLEAQLSARWPAAFDRYSRRPLALGTFHVLLERLELDHVGRKQLRRAIRRWVNHDLYLSALTAPGAARINLAGEVVEAVSSEHQADARERLERRQAEQQRAARQARKPRNANHGKPLLRLGARP